AAIVSTGRKDRLLWGEQPTTVLRRAEKRGEARIGVEARPAQPIDGAVTADESRGLQVSDHRVIFYASRHCQPRFGVSIARGERTRAHVGALIASSISSSRVVTVLSLRRDFMDC